MTHPTEHPAASPTMAAGGPPSFHLLAKPSGATCNIDCTYCFFLSKEALYPNETSRMSDETLEAYIRQLLQSHRTPEVAVAWPGGEPTLIKLDFFKASSTIRTSAGDVRSDRCAEVMKWTEAEDSKRGPYGPCPCGSGHRFKFGHGNKAPASPFMGTPNIHP